MYRLISRLRGYLHYFTYDQRSTQVFGSVSHQVGYQVLLLHAES